MTDQQAVARFLSDPQSYGCGVETVTRIDTHGSIVFLAGDFAYKIKRSVHYPYMDFSTLAKRRTACDRELARNRPSAPTLYLRVTAIVDDGDEQLRFKDDPAPSEHVAEWAVVMRRFDQAQQFDQLASDHRLGLDMARQLADAVADYHDSAERLSDSLPMAAFIETLAWVIEENASEFVGSSDLFKPDLCHRLEAECRHVLASHDALLQQRHEDGFVRRCHGDLHLRNICLWRDRPTLFDAIEFNDTFINIDVFYDLAFLLMDLQHRGLRAHANAVLNRYLERTGDLAALSLLPLFLSLRAAVRAKVDVSMAAVQPEGAERAALRKEAPIYLGEALAFLDPPAPCLVAVGGFSGAGKSDLARRLAPHLGAAPGAVHLRTDAIRKAMFGVPETTRLPPSAYRNAVSGKVYAELLNRAQAALRTGHSVIVDGVFNHADSRAEAEAIASAEKAAFHGLWLEAGEDTLLARVSARTGDASDATAEVVRRQLHSKHGKVQWHRLNTEHPRPDILAAAARHVGVDAM